MHAKHPKSSTPALDAIEVLPPEPGAPPAQAFRVKAEDGAVYHAYLHPHAAVAASVVVRDLSRDAYLLIKREFAPDAGRYAFPGGFIDVGRERLEETAARELFEETGVRVRPDALQLVDARSAPDRDPRDHVLDIGYYVEVESAEAAARDEAADFLWAKAERIETLPLALDHDALWRNVRERVLASE